MSPLPLLLALACTNPPASTLWADPSAPPGGAPQGERALLASVTPQCEVLVTRDFTWWRDKYCVLTGGVTGDPLYPMTIGSKTLSDFAALRGVLNQSFSGDITKVLETFLATARLNAAVFEIEELPYADIDSDGVADTVEQILNRADTALAIGSSADKVAMVKVLVLLNAAGAAEPIWFDERCVLPPERCDGDDDDGDGATDEGCLCDSDRDGYDGAFVGGDDCDDDEEAVNPGQLEVCSNGVDDDCDGQTDTNTWYADLDLDGHGGPSVTYSSCTSPGTAWTLDGSDCDDADDAVYPGRKEACDGVDEDCDAVVDEDAVGATSWYLDLDGDGYGGVDSEVRSCTLVAGATRVGDDCDDADFAVYPGAADAWYDGVDSDCGGDGDFDQDGDGEGSDVYGGTDCDDLDASLNAGTLWYLDLDLDGHGRTSPTLVTCDPGPGWARVPDDCDDTDATASPSEAETWYDGVDQDCAGDDDYDQDGDGVLHPSGGGDDCDDTAAGTYPGASDAWYDGIDSDCAGNDDYDRDGDGDRASAYGGTDCNDLMPSIYGGAAPLDSPTACMRDMDGDGWGDDTPGAGVTAGTDCDDGSAALNQDDADLDGTTSCDGDCDDLDAAVAPHLPEVCGNGVDDDCDGTLNACEGLYGELDLDGAGLTVIGATSEYLGTGAGPGGDLDADGTQDVLVGSGYLSFGGVKTGGVVLVPASARGTVSWDTMAVTLEGVTALDFAGESVWGGVDVDGDGADDAVVGAPLTGTGPEGSAYVVLGPVTGAFDLGTAHAEYVASSITEYLGTTVGLTADLVGDGDPDVLLGSYGSSSTNEGRIDISGTPVGGVASLVSDASVSGTSRISLICNHSAVGDVNGDGQADLVVGDYVADTTTGGSKEGEVHVFFGPLSGAAVPSDSDVTFEGRSNHYLGFGLGAGDADDDGYLDLLAGALYASPGGALYIVPGPLGVSATALDMVDEAWLTLESDTYNSYLSQDFDLSGDVDGDGSADLWVGAPAGEGTAYLFTELAGGTLTLADAEATVVGTSSNSQVGSGFVPIGDLDRDGYADVAQHLPFYTATGTQGGLFLFFGGPGL